MKLLALRALIAGLTALAAVGAHAQSSTPAFNEATRQLTLPVVRLGGTNFLNVTVRLDQFEVLGVGGTEAVEPPMASGQCTMDNFSRTKFYQIVTGMTFQEVTNLIGCAHNPAYTGSTSSFVAYRWQVDGVAAMQIAFDPTGSRVFDARLNTAVGF